MFKNLALPVVFRLFKHYCFSLTFITALVFFDNPVNAAEMKLLDKPKILATEVGKASYYGGKFHGRKTASGSIFDKDDFIAAHPYYPFGTIVRVINLRNRRTIDVEIVDRGPAMAPRDDGVIIDLSHGAAEELDFLRAGRVRVKLEILEWGERF